METAPMKTALSCHDRMAHVVVEFIHHKARSLADEIARAEAAICAISEISISADGTPSDTEARCMLRHLNEHVEGLRALSSQQLGPGRR